MEQLMTFLASPNFQIIIGFVIGNVAGTVLANWVDYKRRKEYDN
jgi:hypothetical protein